MTKENRNIIIYIVFRKYLNIERFRRLYSVIAIARRGVI